MAGTSLWVTKYPTGEWSGLHDPFLKFEAFILYFKQVQLDISNL